MFCANLNFIFLNSFFAVASVAKFCKTGQELICLQIKLMITILRNKYTNRPFESTLGSAEDYFLYTTLYFCIVATKKMQEPCFSKPQREILSIGDVSKWLKSEAHQKFMAFLRCLNSAVKSVSTTSINVTVGETANKIISILDLLEAWIDEYPPEDMGKQRFGNKSFKKWFERFVTDGENLLSDLLSEKLKPAAVELWPYLMDSFGNSTRIDYGSGHEAAFVVFLFCLYQLGVLNSPEDDQASVLRIFHRYLKLVRRLQCEYRMEPAGSRGVHAIDDFQFLPFLFGSAQLIDSKQRLIPDYYLRSEMVTQYQSDNLFFEAIQYINQTKVGAFYEHSNQLYNISAVNTWERINEGMFKMYEGEVLKKFPVVQHFLFGTLFAIKESQTGTVLDPSGLDKLSHGLHPAKLGMIPE